MKDNFTKLTSYLPLMVCLTMLSGCPSDTDVAVALQDMNEPQANNFPLADIQALSYEGAFEISRETFGESQIEYAEGPIAYNEVNQSLFVVGHSHHQAIAEFSIPELVRTEELSDLNMAQTPLQAFTRVLGRAVSGNIQGLNRIGGLAVINGELVINAYDYYDASGSASHTTLVVRDPSVMAWSVVDGYFSMSPRAHASRWISPIPQHWQEPLGGAFIVGSSSGKPIISRHSVGPSAFVFDPMTVAIGTSISEVIDVTTALDFSLNSPLHSDLFNDSGTNDLWTHISYAAYGFIIPNTRTYLTMGYSGGHNSGVGYKITQDNGHECGGYCSRKASDNYNYYWMWDVDDLVRVKNGELLPHSVRPYAYGELPMPFQQSGLAKVIGGSFDITSGSLFVSLEGAGSGRQTPVIAVFKIDSENIGSLGPSSPQALNAQ